MLNETLKESKFRTSGQSQNASNETVPFPWFNCHSDSQKKSIGPACVVLGEGIAEGEIEEKHSKHGDLKCGTL